MIKNMLIVIIATLAFLAEAQTGIGMRGQHRLNSEAGDPESYRTLKVNTPKRYYARDIMEYVRMLVVIITFFAAAAFTTILVSPMFLRSRSSSSIRPQFEQQNGLM